MMRQLIRPLRTALRVQQAEDRLRRYVLDGPLKAGDCLPPEFELSAQLGVGRSTLREAVRVLESQGLVRRRHGVGVEVIDRSDSAAGEMLALVIERRRASQNDLIEMRRVVELQSARWAATRSTEKDRSAIRAALNDMLVPAISPECFAQADLAFHLAIARAAHNVVLFVMLSAVRGLLYDEIVSTLRADFRPGTIRDYHAAILEGIDMRDPEAAASAMTEHLAETERKLKLHQGRRPKKGRS